MSYSLLFMEYMVLWCLRNLSYCAIKVILHFLLKCKHLIEQILHLLIFKLFLAVLGLCCCLWAFSRCREWGLFFLTELRLLMAVTSLVVKHTPRLQGAWVQWLWCTGSVALWHVGIFPGQGSNLMSPALAGEFLTPGPPGKPTAGFLKERLWLHIHILEMFI